PPPRPPRPPGGRRRAGRSPARWCRRPGPRCPRPAPLLPQRRQAERLGEQHLAELPAVHRDRRPRVEGPPEALLPDLAPRRGDASGHLPGPTGLRQAYLERLLPTAQGTADEHRAKQAPKVLIHLPRESGDALLICHGRVAQI